MVGFPCQSFSPAGLHGGVLDKRSEIIRALTHHIGAWAPRFFILEDVLGLASMHRETLEAIITALRNVFTADCDSYKVQVAILDSKNFQAPQRRVRIYIMGVRKMGRTNVEVEWPAPTGTVKLGSIMKHDSKLSSYKSYPMPQI